MSGSPSSVSSNNTHTFDQHSIPVWSHFPPPSFDPQDAGVSDLFAKVHGIALSEGVAMNELSMIGEHIGVDYFDDDPPPSYLDEKDPNYFCFSDLKRAMDGRPEVWYQSFVFEVVTLLGTCLTFRKKNGNKTTAPEETSNVSNYFIPSRTLLDFVRSLEIVCDNHFNHQPTQEETHALQEKFKALQPHDGFRGRWELKDFLQENCGNPYGEFLHDVRKRDVHVQTDLVLFSPPEEKQATTPPAPSVHNVSTQTDFTLPDLQSYPEEKEPTELPLDASRPTRSFVSATLKETSVERPVCSPKVLPKQESPPKPMPMETSSSSFSPNTTTSPPSPKPTSQSSGSSRHTPTRVPPKPHIVLSRVNGASVMDYRDVRRAWDSALDGFSPPSSDLFRSSNIYRLRHLGHTGIGIIFRQPPKHKQLKRFVTACSKQQGRDAFNSGFRSVSSGVHVSMYDEQHQSPPYPTQLRFGDARKTQQWTPPPPIFSTQPQRQPYLPPKHFQPRRPSSSRFPMPSFGNVFSTQPPPPQNQQHFQQQFSHLQQQIQQLMQMQTHILQQLQHMQQNGF